MTRYTFTARHESGHTITGEVEAWTEALARRKLSHAYAKWSIENVQKADAKPIPAAEKPVVLLSVGNPALKQSPASSTASSSLTTNHLPTGQAGSPLTASVPTTSDNRLPTTDSVNDKLTRLQKELSRIRDMAEKGETPLTQSEKKVSRWKRFFPHSKDVTITETGEVIRPRSTAMEILRRIVPLLRKPGIEAELDLEDDEPEPEEEPVQLSIPEELEAVPKKKRSFFGKNKEYNVTPPLPSTYAAKDKSQLSADEYGQLKSVLKWVKKIALKKVPSLQEIMEAVPFMPTFITQAGSKDAKPEASDTPTVTVPRQPGAVRLRLADEPLTSAAAAAEKAAEEAAMAQSTTPTVPPAATAPAPLPAPKKHSLFGAFKDKFNRKEKVTDTRSTSDSPWKVNFGRWFKPKQESRVTSESIKAATAAVDQNFQSKFDQAKDKLISSLEQQKERLIEHADVNHPQIDSGGAPKLSRDEVRDLKATSQVPKQAAQPQKPTQKRVVVLDGFQKKLQEARIAKGGLIGRFKEDSLHRKQDKDIEKSRRLNFRSTKKEQDRKRKQSRTVIQGYKKTGNFFVDLFNRINDTLVNISRISIKDMVTFFNLLAVMVNAGIPLLKALVQLTEHTENKRLKKVLYAIVFEIENGSSLSDAMLKFDKIFKESHIGMVETGEASGQLGDILKQIAREVEKEHNLVSKVRGALIYPATIMAILLIVGVIVMTMIVPKITVLFADSKVALPTSTKLLIGTSTILTSYWYIVLGLIISLGIGFRVYSQTSDGRYYLDYAKIKMPVFGKLLQKLAIARFARSLSTLSQSGLSIIKALLINANSVGNEIYRQEILATAESVKKGIGIAQDLEDNKLFPPVVVNMIAIGEETAQVGPIAGKIAEFYETEVDDAVKNISALIEPLIVVVIGVGVGFMVAAIMQPILQLSEVASAP